ncbi:MAG: methionyl-tRNA formyltransferase [Ruminococcus flavefaciens]|nr:methionyl-tRNA formyltransferase [Ruminococcus flavefaciens]MCM1487422.1 methionyl-tRNA formyltransferase [Bacillota bacterium]
MALITKDNIKKIEKDRNSVHNKVRATYTVFTSGGKKYFQIDTYGSTTRELKNQISQSIQVDEDMAKELIKLMIDIFDIL